MIQYILNPFTGKMDAVDVVNPGLNFLGSWNANTNTPNIASSTGNQGDYYVVSVAGTTTIDGISNWAVGDWIIFNGLIWQQIEQGEFELLANKDIDGTFAANSDTKYPSQKAVKTALTLKEDVANKDTTPTLGTSDTKYPSQKAVKTYVDATKTYSFGITVDGQGGVVSTGSKGFTVIPYGCTITNWYVVGDQSGSIQFDLKRSGVSIIGAGNKPILSGAQRANAAAASWTSVTVAANDEIEFNVDSATTVTRVNLIVEVTKT